MSPAKTNQPTQQPGPEHQRLNVFVGQWKTEGQQYKSWVGPAAKVTAVETYEWLAGNFFLVHRFAGHVGDSEAACLEIIGYDAASRSYPIHTFYNNGLSQEWQSRERDGVWTLTGDWQMAGKPTPVRCTIAFSDDGNTMTDKWEHLDDGSNWQTFWDVKATKVK